jgi:hypothetical protein
VKHFLLVAALVTSSASSIATAVAAPTPAPAKKAAAKPVVPHVVFLKYKVAPADEYFGRLKLSILGIRNTIKDMGLKADADPAHAVSSVMGSVSLTEDAMRDWEKKYPADSWIPPAILSLERLYAKVDSDAARAHAKVVMVWLVHDYPKSAPAKIGQKELSENRVGIKPAVAASAPTAATVAGNPDGSFGTLPIPAK